MTLEEDRTRMSFASYVSASFVGVRPIEAHVPGCFSIFDGAYVKDFDYFCVKL